MADKPYSIRGRAAVVVLGDIGRSPRMQYHALSLARQAHMEVDIVAYGGTDPHHAVMRHPFIHVHFMRQWPADRGSLPKIVLFLILLAKPLFQFFMLLWVLLARIPAPDVFIVQNPPAVPALIAVYCASWFRGSAFIIDWHNFGYTLLGLSLGRSSPFVAVYHWFEKHYGKKAHASLCVTRAMQHELDQTWGIKSYVLYDQPPEFFHVASLEEKHELFYRLGKSINWPLAVKDCTNSSTWSPGLLNDKIIETIFTTRTDTELYLKKNRPALIVSSTSWTPDEDFQILLDAAVIYDQHVSRNLNRELDRVEPHGNDLTKGTSSLYPNLLFIITGKGPEKDKYKEKIGRLHLKHVALHTMWLSAEDYPLLLGSADLGVCLHTSSSGMDLPMKVVDMFGCGLPVCAVSYSCINELVKVDKNGLLFSSSTELADQLLMLFKGFPDNSELLNALRYGATETSRSGGWATEWEEHALPLIDKLLISRRLSSSAP